MSEDALVDTDILLKIGEFRGDGLLAKILLSLGYNLYIHEYLLREEIICGKSAKEQLERMIQSKDIIILRECDLCSAERFDYESALNLMAAAMKVNLLKPRDRNAGEIRSMAMAYSLHFNYFISDDKEARVVAKTILQNLDGSYLQTIRMKDIVVHLREKGDEIGINRRTAKNLYCYGSNPELAGNTQQKYKLKRINRILKDEFDYELWPVE